MTPKKIDKSNKSGKSDNAKRHSADYHKNRTSRTSASHAAKAEKSGKAAKVTEAAKTADATEAAVPAKRRRSGVDVAISIVCIISLLFLIIEVWLVYFSNAKDDIYETEDALHYTSPESLLFKGVYIRNEKILNFTYDGVIAYAQRDGSKLRHGAVIARVYSNADDILRQVRLSGSKARLDVLNDAYRFVGTDTSQIENFRIQLNVKQAEIIQAADAGDYDALAQLKNDYLGLQAKLRVVQTGNSDSFNAKLAALNAEVATLAADGGNVGTVREIVAPEDMSGYFVGFSDGYEDRLNFNSAKTLTEAEINDIIKNPDIASGNRAVGKVVESYRWRFVSVLDSAGIESFHKGSVVPLIIGQGNENATAVIEDIVPVSETKSIVTFECDNLTKNAYIKRVDQFRLVLNNFSGIRVPKKAVRFNEAGEAGVYVAEDNAAVFKKIIIELSQPEYVIVTDVINYKGTAVKTEDGEVDKIAEIPDKDKYLALYDSIITTGKDLYDGKQLYG